MAEFNGATEDFPVYRKILQNDGTATPHYMIVCDEGWRETIVCSDMYEWAADWLVKEIQNKPFAREERPN